MKQLYRLLTLFVFLIVHQYMTAQDQFERRYPVTQSNIVTSSLIPVGSGYASLSVEVNMDEERENINIAFFDQKGTITSSRSVFYGNDTEIKDAGQIIRLEDGSFAFCAVLDKDSLNKVITRIDNLGNHFWTVITGQITDKKELASEPSVLMEAPGERIFHAHTIQAENNTTDIQITSVDYLGEVEYVRSIAFTGPTGSATNERFIKMQLDLDSTIMILGTTDDPDAPFFLSKMDTVGNILWSRSYNQDFGRTLDTEGYDMTQSLDSTWVILGSVLPTVTQRHVGFLMKVDQAGNPLRTEAIRPTSVRYQLYPNGIEGLLDTTVTISMNRLDMISNIYQPLVFNYDLDSLIAFQTLLDTCLSEDPDISDLVTIDSISTTFLTTTVKDNFRIPNLSKLDGQGRTQCEEFVQAIMIDSVNFTIGDLVPTVTSMMIEDSIDVELRPFGQYNPPILTLQDTTYCPEDPINYFVDATVRGGTTYIWDDGTTEPIRILTEEGMFMVTVTVREDICFTLCDTLTITKLEFPMVEIGKNFGNYCTSGAGILNANISGASIESFMWNTGSTEAAIVVDGTPMSYSVTVVDGCGNVAMANTTVSESDYLAPNPLGLVIGDRDMLCATGVPQITATMQSDPSLITWSTGANNTLSITVNEPGTYTADVSGFCPDSESITITDDDFIQPVEAEITQDCYMLTVAGSGFSNPQWSTGAETASITVSSPGTYNVIVMDECGVDQDPIDIVIGEDDLPGLIDAQIIVECGEPRRISLSGSGFNSQVWSTGETSESIEVTQPGTFSVTVTGDAAGSSECQNMIILSENIEQGDIEQSSGCLLWPNAFQPEDGDIENRTFGPMITGTCADDIVSYELQIYNRWGKNIFTSNSVDVTWNGAINGDRQPGGVYYYWATYDDGTSTCERRGDVTLLR